jgi:hypothetical protein
MSGAERFKRHKLSMHVPRRTITAAERRKVLCGRWVWPEQVARHWKDVTCLRCQRHQPG